MPSFSVTVDNLKCGGCASTIHRRLMDLPGVQQCLVDVESGTVQLQHDGRVERASVEAALFTLGYPPTGTGGMVQKAKSYVSCAVGRLHGGD